MSANSEILLDDVISQIWCLR